MIKTLQNTLKQDKEHLTVPKSVQDTIPIRRIWPDGLFQFGGKFSKTIRFSDINYATRNYSMPWTPALPPKSPSTTSGSTAATLSGRS